MNVAIRITLALLISCLFLGEALADNITSENIKENIISKTGYVLLLGDKKFGTYYLADQLVPPTVLTEIGSKKTIFGPFKAVTTSTFNKITEECIGNRLFTKHLKIKIIGKTRLNEDGLESFIPDSISYCWPLQ